MANKKSEPQVTQDEKVGATMSISEAQEFLHAEYLDWLRLGHQRRFFVLKGPPGTAKTESIEQIARRLKLENPDFPGMLDLSVASSSEPEEQSGSNLPVVIHHPDGSQSHVLKTHFPEELEAFARKPGGILRIDEIGRTPEACIGQLLKLLSNEKMLGRLDCRNVWICLADNDAESGNYRMATIFQDAAFNDRAFVINIDPNPVEVGAHLAKKGGPSHLLVGQYLSDRGEDFMTGRDVGESPVRKVRSARSFEALAELLHCHGEGTDERAGDPSAPFFKKIASSVVGTAAALDFFEWTATDLPNSVEKILDGRFQPNPNEIIVFVPNSVVLGLERLLTKRVLSSAEARRVAAVLALLPMDQAVRFVHNQKDFLKKNVGLLASAPDYKEFLKKFQTEPQPTVVAASA